MKARPVDYTRGYRDGQKDGIRKAIKALGASIDIKRQAQERAQFVIYKDLVERGKRRESQEP